MSYYSKYTGKLVESILDNAVSYEPQNTTEIAKKLARLNIGALGEDEINNYDNLINKPTINGVELNSTTTSESLGLVKKEEGKVLSSNDYTTEDKQKLAELKNYDDAELRGLIPTNTSQLNNDSGFLTEHQSLEGYIKSEAIADMETKTHASQTYQAKGEYATKAELADKADKENVVAGGAGVVAQELQPNTFYKFGECTSLTITLAAEKEGVYNSYSFEFVSGSSATTLSVPEGVKWMSELKVEANKTYQVSISNNLGVIGGW